MKNHFIFPYAGNKREEVEIIHEFIKDKLEGIDTIIEPFCGTSAISCYLSQLYPKKYKYILNDLDSNLIELYNVMKDKDKFQKFSDEFQTILKTITNKDIYLGITKQPTLMAWFIKNKVCKIRPGLSPEIFNFTTNKYLLKDIGIINFLLNEDVTITCGDGTDIIKSKQNNSNCLFFIDPPYIMSYNLFYEAQKTNIYEFFKDNDIGAFASSVVLVLEDNWIIRVIFKSFIKQSYDKQYKNAQRKKTNHIIIMNK